MCLLWILAQVNIIPSEGEDGGEGGQLFLPKVGLWDAGVPLYGILMSVTQNINPCYRSGCRGVAESCLAMSKAIVNPEGRALKIIAKCNGICI